VVQDYTGEEGTGVWSNDEAVDQHVPAPTLTSAHFLRIASGDLEQRRTISKTFGGAHVEEADSPMGMLESHRAILEQIRFAVYGACLEAYAQGLNIIDKANTSKHFNIDYSELLQVWRNGCIIRADHINREVLFPIYKVRKTEFLNPLYDTTFAEQLKLCYPSLRHVVMMATGADQVIPSLSASLEYIKYMTSTDLPTSFYEAELDYFGSHMYDKKGDDPEGKPETGKHHFEWKPA